MIIRNLPFILIEKPFLVVHPYGKCLCFRCLHRPEEKYCHEQTTCTKVHKLHGRRHAHVSWNVMQHGAVCSYMRAPSVIGLHRERRGGPEPSVVAVSRPMLEN